MGICLVSWLSRPCFCWHVCVGEVKYRLGGVLRIVCPLVVFLCFILLFEVVSGSLAASRTLPVCSLRKLECRVSAVLYVYVRFIASAKTPGSTFTVC